MPNPRTALLADILTQLEVLSERISLHGMWRDVNVRAHYAKLTIQAICMKQEMTP
jgi:hypothetical protein